MARCPLACTQPYTALGLIAPPLDQRRQQAAVSSTVHADVRQKRYKLIFCISPHQIYSSLRQIHISPVFIRELSGTLLR